VAVGRSPAAAPQGATFRAITGVGDAAGLRAAFEGAAQVVHLAARVHVMREREPDPLGAFRRTNVEGALVAYRAACDAGVGRFVFVSSVKVHGEGRATPYTESDAPAPLDPYGVSKLEAERALAAARAGGAPCEVTVVRPPLVYGPGVGGNFRQLLRLAHVAQRWPLPLGGIDNRRSLVAVGNLADALQLLTRHPAASGRTFLVSDGLDLSTSELLARLAAALGRPARLWRVPGGLLRAAAALAGRAAQADRLLGTLTVDASRLRHELGWRPTETFETGIRKTLRWYLDNPDWVANVQSGAYRDWVAKNYAERPAK